MLTFSCQQHAVSNLRMYASQDKHSLVIEGTQSCGKTYLAKQYARMLSIPDVVSVNAKVNDIKDAFASFSRVSNNVVIVIENLDSGVPACSYVLLKFMEEPSSNLYIVVTCESMRNIPDTIVSRSMTVTVQPATYDDLQLYAQNSYMDKYSQIKRTKLWKCAKSFSDVDTICNLSSEQYEYVSKWSSLKMFSGSVNNISWKLGHYPDSSEVKSNIIVKYVMECNKENMHVVNSCISCLDALASRKIASYLVLSKLAFDLKYCE